MPTLTSSASATSSASSSPALWWLKDPSNSNLNIELFLIPSVALRSAEDSVKFAPIGRQAFVVVSDVIRTEVGELTLFFQDNASYEAFETIRNNQRVLLLQSNLGEQWYVRLGDRTVEILNSFTADRKVIVAITEVDAP